MISLVFISACDNLGNLDLSNVSEKDVNKIIVCKAPYMRFASGCCLDKNDNKICDNDEFKNNEKQSDVKEDKEEFQDQDNIIDNKDENEYYLRVGENVTFADKIISLVNVGSSGNIIVNVNNLQEVISLNSYKIVNGLKISNLESSYADDLSGRSAKIKAEISDDEEEDENEYYLKVSEYITFNGLTVTLLDVGSGGNIIVKVGSVQEVISADSEKIINGLEIENEDAFYVEDKYERSARIKISIADSEDEDEEIGQLNCNYDIVNLDYNLSDYPKPFIDFSNKKFDYRGVVGFDSPAVDSLTLSDIVSGLANTEVEGGKIAEIDIAPAGLLDTQVTNPKENNLILIGTTSNNRLVAEFLGLDYSGSKGKSCFEKGKAKIILMKNEDKIALIVTGYSSEDIRRAGNLLRYYENNKDKLRGYEITI